MIGVSNCNECKHIKRCKNTKGVDNAYGGLECSNILVSERVKFMEDRKWLKRKYPETFEEINYFLNDERLHEFKTKKYKLGKLIKDVHGYKENSLIMFKRSNPVNSLNYPLHYGVVKCGTKITTSGYHGIGIYDSDFVEIKK